MRKMAAQQLHLFEPARPLLQRFGAEFFRAVPRKPGVYIMGGDDERVLYIGQSGNLRHRLGSYKNARLDRAPRKVIRLVHLVRTLVWEECATAEEARLRENHLLRIHRPKFNVQNTYPPAYQFIGVRSGGDRLTVCLENQAISGAKTYGAFKSGCLLAYAALLRRIWAAIYRPIELQDFPSPLLGVRAPREYHFEPGWNAPADDMECWRERLDGFLAGESEGLIDVLRKLAPREEDVCPFQRNLQAYDFEILQSFFEHGPKRNRALCAKHGIRERIIPQDKLDDLLVKASSGRNGRELFEGEPG
jgi:predicted GIY-YIG superfamily endonuclease